LVKGNVKSECRTSRVSEKKQAKYLLSTLKANELAAMKHLIWTKLAKPCKIHTSEWLTGFAYFTGWP